MHKKIFLHLAVIAILASCSKSLYVKEKQASLNTINSTLPVDSGIIRYYDPYKIKLDSQMNRVIGYSETEMVKKQPESILGNFFSDAIAQTVQRRNINFDFAIPSTNGGMRAALPKGNITVRNVFELMPFENELVILTLSGKDVKSLAEFIVSKNGQPVSGITIKSVNKQLQEVIINGETLNENKKYRVLTSDYLAGGGDGIEAFKNAIARENLSIKARDAIIEYIEIETRSGHTLNPAVDGRINIQ
jgi:2',3'-cyclic-nucleotide 2'-phosphodiesterase (5'-nucleotidase family)